MKRLGSSDSLGAPLMSICPTAEEHNPSSHNVYSREFQCMVDGDDEEGCVGSEKKRRLSVQQVKALEKDFEVENKLEPERKVKLAQDLGLQPRQVAVWFQNRRARWKTKQLERDYGVLKSNYDNLKLNHQSLQLHNEALIKEITEFKSKLNEEASIKEERFASGTENNHLEESDEPSLGPTMVALSENKELDCDEVLIFPGLKDGSSEDSDSSAILNEDTNSPNAAISSSGALQNHNKNSSLKFSCSTSSSHSQLNCFQFSDPKAIPISAQKAVYLPQLVKLEEHNFFSGEEACNFFSDEQAPSLHWYCPDQWN